MRALLNYHNSSTLSSNKTVKALVTTGEGKFYSNGLDLDTLATYNEEELNEFDRLYQAVHKTILTFPMITIACLNGKHTL